MRTAGAVLVAVLAGLLLPLAMVSAWTAERVTDTGGYVGATAPLATDPVVRREVSARLVALVEQSVPSGPTDLVPGSAALADTVVEQAVAGALRSRLFRRTWRAATRASHAQLLAALRGEAGAGRIDLDLAPVLDSVTTELAGYGLPVGDLPAVQTRISIDVGPGLGQTQRGYRVLERIGWRGAVAWFVLVGLALAVSPARRRTTGWLGWGAALTAGAALGALLLARSAAIAAVSAPDRDLVAAITDVLTGSLVRGFEVATGVALVVGLVTLLAPRRD